MDGLLFTAGQVEGLEGGHFSSPFSELCSPLLLHGLLWLPASCAKVPPPFSFHSSLTSPLSFGEDFSGTQNLLLTTGAIATKSCYHMLTPPLLPNPKRTGGEMLSMQPGWLRGQRLKKGTAYQKCVVMYGNDNQQMQHTQF